MDASVLRDQAAQDEAFTLALVATGFLTGLIIALSILGWAKFMDWWRGRR